MTNINDQIAAGWGAIGEEDKPNGGGKKERPEYLTLPLGDTKVRLLDLVPHVYYEWFSPVGNGAIKDGERQHKGCSIPYFGEGDLLEAENDAFMKKIFKQADDQKLEGKERKNFLRDEGYQKQPWGKLKKKAIIHVLDRATGEVKLLNGGMGIFNAIKKYAENPEYGDPRKYDITITKTDKGGKGNWYDIEYTVAPARQNTPLTEAEQKLYEEKRIDLAELKGTGNMTPEQAYQIAKGATFAEVLGKDSEGAEATTEKSNPDMLPKEEDAPQEAPETPQKEEAVDVNKGEELSAEELEGLEF